MTMILTGSTLLLAARIAGGCGGSDAEITSSDGGGGGASSSGSSGSSGGVDGGTEGDGGGDAGDAGDAGDGGGDGMTGQSNAGLITCGTATCNLQDGGGDTCCLGAADAGVCQGNASCALGSIAIRCDEPADCPTDEPICCLNPTGIGAGSQCNNDCGGSNVPACKTNAQCGDGGTCRVVTCPALSGGNRVFRACTVPQGCQ